MASRRSILGSRSRRDFMAQASACLSHCTRVPRTAGPLERFRVRNWMPVKSANSPMAPAQGVDLFDHVALARPPTAGLQAIWAMVSRLRLKSSTLRPMRAAARAPSQPAWPAPMTMKSYSFE